MCQLLKQVKDTYPVNFKSGIINISKVLLRINQSFCLALQIVVRRPTIIDRNEFIRGKDIGLIVGRR